METILNSGLIWWITVIDVPAMSALFFMILRNRRETEKGLHITRQELAEFKVEVARNYAAIKEVKDGELRIINHLLRIEQKLDKTALKTENLSAHLPF